MSKDQHTPSGPSGKGAVDQPAEKRPLTPEAQRALEEAAARRAERDGAAAEQPTEIAGRGGLDPNRYGDWEINGLTPDF